MQRMLAEFVGFRQTISHTEVDFIKLHPDGSAVGLRSMPADVFISLEGKDTYPEVNDEEHIHVTNYATYQAALIQYRARQPASVNA